MDTRRLPPASKRFVQSDQRERGVALTLGERVVGRVQRPLGIENGQEALDASLVEKLRDIGRFGICGGFRRKLI